MYRTITEMAALGFALSEGWELPPPIEALLSPSQFPEREERQIDADQVPVSLPRRDFRRQAVAPKKTLLTFGLISGGLSATLLLVTATIHDRIGFDRGEILGYTLIVLSALFIFFGVRSYAKMLPADASLCPRFRRRHPHHIDFKRLLRRQLGDHLLQIHARLRRQIRRLLDRESQSLRGQSGKNREEDSRSTKHFNEIYKNPAVNIAMTFMEVFPIGLGVTLLSAAILRKRTVNAPGVQI